MEATPHHEQVQRHNYTWEVLKYPKVKEFIDSISRKSLKTGQNYVNSLLHFKKYLEKELPNYDLESILSALKSEKVDVYQTLDRFVSYLMDFVKAKPNSIAVYMAGVRSYLQYHAIHIISSLFKHRVRLPSARQEDEYPLDAAEARQILLAISNRKMKAYCMVLASGGPRAVEAAAIRVKDVDFAKSPTAIYMQAKYSKNKLPRTIYISDEATAALQSWLGFKYRNQKQNPDDFVFSTWEKGFDPTKNHSSFAGAFIKVLRVANLDMRKDGQIRHKITLHSFRRLVETTCEDNTSANYADYILGHKKSSYYAHKEDERRRIYKEKCMKYLTFLDYSAIENRGRGLDTKLEQMQQENLHLKQDMDKRIAEEVAKQLKMVFYLRSQNPELENVKPEELAKLKPKLPTIMGEP